VQRKKFTVVMQMPCAIILLGHTFALVKPDAIGMAMSVQVKKTCNALRLCQWM